MSQNVTNISQIEVLRNMMETAMYRIYTFKAVEANILNSQVKSFYGLSRVDNMLITPVNFIVPCNFFLRRKIIVLSCIPPFFCNIPGLGDRECLTKNLSVPIIYSCFKQRLWHVIVIDSQTLFFYFKKYSVFLCLCFLYAIGLLAL